MTFDFRALQVQTNKLIPSGSTGTNAKLLIYPITSEDSTTPNQGVIDPAKFSTGSIGNDALLFVSGVINGLDKTNNGASVFGGDVHVSGTLRVGTYISGSHTKLADGNPAFIAGPNMVITFNDNGAVEITGSAGGTSLTSTAIKTANYTATANERVQYNPSGGVFTISASSSPSGDVLFGVKNVTTSSKPVIIHGNGNDIEDPINGFLTGSFILTTASLVSVHWYYSSQASAWLVD